MSLLDISTDHCLVEQREHTLLITLNRPDAKNAFSQQMLMGLYRAWRRLDADGELRCAVLTANGDTFCAGMDLKSGPDQALAAEFDALRQQVPDLHWQALLRHQVPSKPIILAVEGYALAGGTEILQGTDIRVCANNAVFGITEVARGLFPLGGSSVRLRRQIPYCLAAEMLLTGRHVSAREALDWGLVNRVVEPGQALAEALQIAGKICTNGPLAVGAVLKSLRANGAHLSEEEALRQELIIGQPVFQSQDAQEGMRAFAEKRTPIFRGL
jgi:enoyl-CoA hydratase